jgi:hypothetical protein
MYGEVAERFIAPDSKSGGAKVSSQRPRGFESHSLRPSQLALFETIATADSEILPCGGLLMATVNAGMLQAMADLIQAKEALIIELKSEIETAKQAYKILCVWTNSDDCAPFANPTISRKKLDSPIRDMVLEIVGNRTTFKLGWVVDQLLESGKMSGDKRAVYGTVTGTLRRNNHLFKKVRRGIYRVKQTAQPVESKEVVRDENESPYAAPEETPVH